jgi:hypothetical protein
MLSLSSTAEALTGLLHAKEVHVQAYTLPPDVAYDLTIAARRGAHVSVELEGTPHNDRSGRLARENGRIVERLRAAGVDARLSDPVHAKLIEEDGTLYLDAKNWRNGDLVLRADRADAAAIPMIKHQALAAEARLLNAAQVNDGAIVASESFGRGNSVYFALDRLAKEGLSPRLLVCARELSGNVVERATLAKLVRDGVRVRVTKDSEKLAAVGDGAWIGSANATIAFQAADLPDWGVATRDPSIARAVRNRLETEWDAAKEFKRLTT